MGFPVQLRRTGVYLREHWKRFIAAFIAGILWVARALFEDQIVSAAKELIASHANWFLHMLVNVGLLFVHYPAIPFFAVLAAITFHAYWVSNQAGVNLVCDSVATTTVLRESDIYRRRANTTSTQMGQMAIVLQLSNAINSGKNIVSAGKVKAQAHLYIEQYTPKLISPLVWLEEPCNSAAFDVGDTRSLLLMLATDPKSEWVMMVNRRGKLEDPIGLDYDFALWPDSKGHVEINLLKVESGTLLKTIRLTWNWSYGYARPSIRKLEQD